MIGIIFIIIGNIIFWTSNHYSKEYQPNNYHFASRIADFAFWLVFLGVVIMIGEIANGF